MYRDGLRGEQYFQEFCKANKLKHKLIHRPFDFLVENRYVEVKSCKLIIPNNGGKLCHERYECWGKSQVEKLKIADCWVCFIIQTNEDCMIQGFIKSQDLKIRDRKVGIFELQKQKLRSTKQFIQYIRRKRKCISKNMRMGVSSPALKQQRRTTKMKNQTKRTTQSESLTKTKLGNGSENIMSENTSTSGSESPKSYPIQEKRLEEVLKEKSDTSPSGSLSTS